MQSTLIVLLQFKRLFFFGDGCVPCIHVLDLIVIHHHLYWFYCFFSHSVLNLPWTFVLYFRPKYGDHSHTDSAHIGIIAKEKHVRSQCSPKEKKRDLKEVCFMGVAEDITTRTSTTMESRTLVFAIFQEKVLVSMSLAKISTTCTGRFSIDRSAVGQSRSSICSCFGFLI